MSKATLNDALKLCRIIEDIAPDYGAHIALTGGCLYKEGERKDIDLILYRIRQVPKVDWVGLVAALAKKDIIVIAEFGFVSKAEWGIYDIDIMFPEAEDGNYNIDILFPEAEVGENK